METCGACKRTFSEEIIVHQGSKKDDKSICKRAGVAYPIRYYKCPHCEAKFCLCVDNKFHQVVGTLPYGIENWTKKGGK